MLCVQREGRPDALRSDRGGACAEARLLSEPSRTFASCRHGRERR